MSLRFDARDPRHWRCLFAAGIAVMLGIHAIDIFVRPWWSGVGDVVIADDARQFLSWMPRLRDPHALPGDRLADFWQAMSPPAYAGLYRLAASLGSAPTVTARLVSLATLALSAVAAWRLARAVARDPAIAFCAAAFVMAFVSKEDAVFSATPRGLAVPAILFFLDGVARDRWRTMAVSGAALALLYPAPGATLVTAMALYRLRPAWPPLRLPDLWSMLAIGGAMASLVLLFREQAHGWGPALTLAEARGMPVLMTPGARSTLVNEAGSIAWLCSMRAGFLPEIVPCGRGVSFAAFANLLFLAPLLWLAMRGVLRGGPARIYAAALFAACLWFAVAWSVAFALHLPSRFSQRVLYPLEWLAIGQVVGEALRAMARGQARRWAVAATGAFLTVAFLTPLAMLQQPSDRRVIDIARSLPADTRIGGVSNDLQFLPTIAGRAITASPQHAIPWETGYYRHVNAGLVDALEALSTGDARTLAFALRRSRADWLLLPPHVLNGEIPDEYRRAMPVEAAIATDRMADRQPLVRTLAPQCRLGDSDYVSVNCMLALLDDRRPARSSP